MDHGRSRLGLTARWLALAAAAAVAVGCGGAATPAGSTAPTATEPAATRPATSALQTVTVYFPDARALHILPERRSVPADGEALRLALEELAAGPRSAELLPALPAGTAVIDARLVDGTARIDLDAAFERGYPSGGAAGEIAVLAPLVYTATAVDGAQRALITVEGRAPALAGSQFDFSEPLARSDFPDDLLGR